MSSSPDPAALAAPVLFEGAWLYPTAWSPEDRLAWEGIQGRKIHEDKKRDDIETAAAALAASPAALLSAARAEADEAQRRREFAERRAAGETAWRAAVEQHGDRVRRLDLLTGDTLIMLGMTRTEADAVNARAANLRAAAANKIQAINDSDGAHRDAMGKKLLHPAPERVKALAERYADFWDEATALRDDLVRVRQLDEGKDSAL